MVSYVCTRSCLEIAVQKGCQSHRLRPTILLPLPAYYLGEGLGERPRLFFSIRVPSASQWKVGGIGTEQALSDRTTTAVSDNPAEKIMYICRPHKKTKRGDVQQRGDGRYICVGVFSQCTVHSEAQYIVIHQHNHPRQTCPVHPARIICKERGLWRICWLPSTCSSILPSHTLNPLPTQSLNTRSYTVPPHDLFPHPTLLYLWQNKKTESCCFGLAFTNEHVHSIFRKNTHQVVPRGKPSCAPRPNSLSSGVLTRADSGCSSRMISAVRYARFRSELCVCQYV